MKLVVVLAFASLLSAGPPAIKELQPRGAQKGRPFKLVVVGTNLGDGPVIVSTLPATFTPLGLEKPKMENRSAEFLVEPTGEWNVGVYPIRVKAANGISNILLLSIGAFPETRRRRVAARFLAAPERQHRARTDNPIHCADAERHAGRA